jgi:hypothetical protein
VSKIIAATFAAVANTMSNGADPIMPRIPRMQTSDNRNNSEQQPASRRFITIEFGDIKVGKKGGSSDDVKQRKTANQEV